MATYVTDTHSLLWYLGGSPLLGAAARAAFDEAARGASEVIIPAIAVAELVMLSEKRHGQVDIGNIVKRLREQSHFQFAPLQPDTALRIQTLTALRDIHDRLIVAEAQERVAPLITRDLAITASGLVKTVW